MRYIVSTGVAPVKKIANTTHEDIMEKGEKDLTASPSVLNDLDVIKATLKFPNGSYVIWATNLHELENIANDILSNKNLDPSLCSLHVSYGPIGYFGLDDDTRDWIIYKVATRQPYWEELDSEGKYVISYREELSYGESRRRIRETGEGSEGKE
jgi:hypothetical protein